MALRHLVGGPQYFRLKAGSSPSRSCSRPTLCPIIERVTWGNLKGHQRTRLETQFTPDLYIGAHLVFPTLIGIFVRTFGSLAIIRLSHVRIGSNEASCNRCAELQCGCTYSEERNFRYRRYVKVFDKSKSPPQSELNASRTDDKVRRIFGGGRGAAVLSISSPKRGHCCGARSARRGNIP